MEKKNEEMTTEELLKGIQENLETIGSWKKEKLDQIGKAREFFKKVRPEEKDGHEPNHLDGFFQENLTARERVDLITLALETISRANK